MFLVVCLCLWDFAGNPWITCEFYVFSHFYLVQHVPMHAFGKKNSVTKPCHDESVKNYSQ
jgi:hypothetical protein